MQTMTLASYLPKVNGDSPRIDQRDLELHYPGPRNALKDINRVGAALAGVLLYAGLLAYAWQ
jgi:hypothetical protein